MKFTPLHINTEYSFNHSSIKIDELIKKAKENNIKKIIITDRNNMFGVSEFLHKTKKEDIKPIIGLDLNVENYRLILIAKNYEGYIELNYLSTKRMNNELILLNQINSPNYFIIDHPTKGFYAKKNESLDAPNYFIGTNNPQNPGEVYVQEGLFLEEDDRETIDILSKMNDLNVSVDNLQPLKFNLENKLWAEQINSIVDECNIDFPKNENPLPKYQNKDNLNSIDYLKKIIKENIQIKLQDNPNIKKYTERLKYEISIIEELGFEDYFLIIWDLIDWAKRRNIAIGPGRGSAAGSLVAYTLNITEIDPIEYNLLFERFLNPKRISMPDIDIDIQDNRRNEVIDYLFKRYGENNVGLISTFSRLGAKSSIRDIARYYEVPMREINTISKLIPSDLNLKDAYKKSANFRALINSSDKYQRIYDLARKIEGLPRQYSTHAAGIVISDKDLKNKTATVKVNGEYNQIHFPMDHLEENGLLKIDLLGLKNLTTIKQIQKEIYINHKKRVDLKKIPFDDKLTNDLLSRGDTNGIFQLESYGMKKTLVNVGVDSLDDITAIISLFRPGPMDMIPFYEAVKKGLKPFPSISPEYDKITKSTHGIIIYQEQIMEIAQKISNMSFSQADILRRAISKKDSNLLHDLKNNFINGGIQNGYSNEIVLKIFNVIEKFGNYGFNKSHAVAYATLAYRMAYLKARFKFEYYTALLSSSMGSQTSIKKYVQEAKRHNINVIAPIISKSKFKVYNKNNEIILPMQLIKGFGDAAAKKILDEKEKNSFKNFFDFVSKIRFVGVGESVIETLIQANVLREFGNMQTLMDSLPLALRYSNMITMTKDNIRIIDKSIMSEPNLIISERNISNEIFNEKKLLGFQINAFATLLYEKVNKLNDVKEAQGKEVVFLVEKIHKYKTNNDESIGKIIISDSTMNIEVTAFYDVLKFIEKTKNGTIVIGKLKVNKYKGNEYYVLIEPWRGVENG